ncbi:MAG TPA: F0F1 ATP synthase subunit A [Tepidisphaeraceae bacterium]|nr:F0F1 ATP synthase subunit A [Tepidisphaeraceae bacterium]
MLELVNITTLAAANPLDHVVDHPILQSNGWWYLTNHMIMMCVSAGLMLLIFPAMTKRYRSGEWVPTGSRNFFEAILIYMRDDVAKPLLGHDTTRYMPYLWTLFFFILFTNLLGLLPIDLITGKLLGLNHGHGIYGTATANFYVTATLAIITFLVVQISGLRANGIGGWAKHFLGGAPWYIAPVMIPVEFLGMLIKPFALAVRLAANMTAGHILLAVIIGFVPAAFVGLGTAGGWAVGVVSVISAVAINCLELFVAFLQAYLFTFLTALFISQMITHEHDDHEHDAHDEADHHGHPVVAEVADHKMASKSHQM